MTAVQPGRDGNVGALFRARPGSKIYLIVFQCPKQVITLRVFPKIMLGARQKAPSFRERRLKTLTEVKPPNPKN